MTVNGHDPFLAALGGLIADPPRDLVGLVFAQWVRVPGPVGDTFVAFSDNGVSYVRTAESVRDDGKEFEEAFRVKFGRPIRPGSRVPAGLRPALKLRAAARSLVFDLRGLSPFERDVLNATRLIPAGQTRPYSWVAREVGRPGAVRAVGTALGNNPVPLLIPCHRVVRSDGRIGEYVFGP